MPEEESWMNWNRLLSPDLIWIVIPVAAILVGGVLQVLKQSHRHQERLAMIDHGINPDCPVARGGTN